MLSPEELKAHVIGLLDKGIPIGTQGQMIVPEIKKRLYGEGKNTVIGSKAVVPTVGKELTKLSSKSTWDREREDYYNNPWDDTPFGRRTGVVNDACQRATLLSHPYMPKGSRIVKMMRDEWHEDGGNHYVHVVPTTEGPHVVDFTHAQFDENIDGPLVEPLDKYNERQASQDRKARRTLTAGTANRLAEAAAYGDWGSVYNQSRRDAIKVGQYFPSEISTAYTTPPQVPRIKLQKLINKQRKLNKNVSK